MAIDRYGQIIRKTPRPMSLRPNPTYETLTTPSTASTNTTTTSTPSIRQLSHRNGPWNRFDYFIGRIGNMIANVSDNITSACIILGIIGLLIPFVLWLISLGWLWGIIAGVCLGGLAFAGISIIAYLIAFVVTILLALVRYIFYSGTSFLIVLATVATIWGVKTYIDSEEPTPAHNLEYFDSDFTTPYRCTARTSLKVRTEPKEYALIMGALSHDEVVEVYEITNGFAKIKYNDRYGYASVQYLEKIQ